MRHNVLGIDLGTSSVKLLLWHEDGTMEKAKASYDGIGCQSWLNALRLALKQLDVSAVTAIGLSSQVGTYVVNKQHIIPWNSALGKEELLQLKSEVGVDTFIREISMPHPDISSYPIPRLMYIKKQFQMAEKICQPKDYLCQMLTGNYVTDRYSWRGLVNMETGQYSDWALDYVGIRKEQLPTVCSPFDQAGELLQTDLGIPGGIPIYMGCNDFFAGIVGMNVKKDIFDITGTSEHVGIITSELHPGTKMVNGPYFEQYVHYGVTASSGPSMEFCLKNFMPEVDITTCLEANPPLFLPYLKGERAPVWNPDATGVFFGIETQCEKQHLAYSVMEGIVFSLYHIYEQLHVKGKRSLIVTGGAAQNATLNRLKAELFDMPVKTLMENDTSALGAVMLAAVGCGIFPDLESAANVLCKVNDVIYPQGNYRELLLSRFALYKQIYPSVQHLFAEKKSLSNRTNRSQQVRRGTFELEQEEIK